MKLLINDNLFGFEGIYTGVIEGVCGAKSSPFFTEEMGKWLICSGAKSVSTEDAMWYVPYHRYTCLPSANILTCQGLQKHGRFADRYSANSTSYYQPSWA
jgi:hypothetical protein